jgi:hypothetical protein
MPEMTEAQLDDAIAASYLRDFRIVADNDRRMYKFALTTAAREKSTEHRTETDRAKAVGGKIKGAFSKMLSPGQHEDATGHLFAQFLAHVSESDLGFYYLNKEKERWSNADG